jgi:hypothetical protein
MIEWINSNGILCLIGYYVLISTLGTMPELPHDASYMHKWAYAAAHALCGNMQKMVSSLKPNGNGKPKE